MQIPTPRGRLLENRKLADFTWLRVGGPADYIFQPADFKDLADFLDTLPRELSIFPIGVGSNIIVRDGGIRSVVIRLGKGFNDISFENDLVHCGAAILDAHVARKAADKGLDLTFLRTIPGSIGGALKMNAGCYGTYFSDVFVSAEGVDRKGRQVEFNNNNLKFGYRNSNLPLGVVITKVTLLSLGAGSPDKLHKKMQDQVAVRNQTQPIKERTAGSTFKNPSGLSSTGEQTDTHEFKAWKLIDDAGCRGKIMGGAQMSLKHSNFLINKGSASAHELEALGEFVRKKVYDTCGLTLEWEIMRVGEPHKKPKR